MADKQNIEGQAYSAGLARAVELLAKAVSFLRFSAGDPERAERCIFTTAPTAVTDTAIVGVQEMLAGQDPNVTKDYSTLLITFTEASGRGRFLIDGGFPTAAAGRGVPILSGGGELEIKGAENIRRFAMIAETGQALNFTAMFFASAVLREEN